MQIYDALLNRTNAATLGISLPVVTQVSGAALWPDNPPTIDRYKIMPSKAAIDTIEANLSTLASGSVILLDMESALPIDTRAVGWPIIRETLIQLRARREDLIWGLYLMGWGDRGSDGTYTGTDENRDHGTLDDMVSITDEAVELFNGVVHFVSPDLYERPNTITSPAQDLGYLERIRWTLTLCKRFNVPIIPCVSPIFFPSAPKTYVSTGRLQLMVQVLEAFADGWMIWGDPSTSFSSGDSWIPILAQNNWTRSGRSGTAWRDGATNYWTHAGQRSEPKWPVLPPAYNRNQIFNANAKDEILIYRGLGYVTKVV